jgi:hypothetical protein
MATSLPNKPIVESKTNKKPIRFLFMNGIYPFLNSHVGDTVIKVLLLPVMGSQITHVSVRESPVSKKGPRLYVSSRRMTTASILEFIRRECQKRRGNAVGASFFDQHLADSLHD